MAIKLTNFAIKRKGNCQSLQLFYLHIIDLKSDILGSSKLKDEPLIAEKFEEKKYLSEMSLHDAMMLFRIRSKTDNVWMNQQSDRENARNLWKCTECGNVDTQSHILWCPYILYLMGRKMRVMMTW